MNLLALTSAELWLAVIVIVVVVPVLNAMASERVHGAVTVSREIIEKHVSQLHQRVNQLAVVDELTLPTRKTQLEIHVKLAKLLADVIETDEHRDQAIAACKALDDFNARSAAQSIHKHEEMGPIHSNEAYR